LHSARVGLLALALVAAPVIAGEESHSGRDHKNEVALFLGWTDESGHATEPTWGVD
jgi:hypothetical protein